MYRLVSFIVIFSFAFVMLYFHNQTSHYMSGHTEEHAIVEIPSDAQIPSVDGSVHQDHSGAWYVEIETTDFTFLPEKAGLDEVDYNEGHAHLYVNGEKINRMYGNYYNLDYLDNGSYTVKVTLHANNHSMFVADGEEIGFEQKVVVD